MKWRCLKWILKDEKYWPKRKTFPFVFFLIKYCFIENFSSAAFFFIHKYRMLHKFVCHSYADTMLIFLYHSNFSICTANTRKEDISWIVILKRNVFSNNYWVRQSKKWHILLIFYLGMDNESFFNSSTWNVDWNLVPIKRNSQKLLEDTLEHMYDMLLILYELYIWLNKINAPT